MIFLLFCPQVVHQLEGDADVLAEVENVLTASSGWLVSVSTSSATAPAGVGHEAGTLVVTLVQVQRPRILLTTATAQGDSSEQTQDIG